MCFKGL